jgi:SAM-dependent methyltransferase
MTKHVTKNFLAQNFICSIKIAFMGENLDNQPKPYSYGGKPEEALRLEVQGRVYSRLIENEIALLSLKPGMQVLDAGCGTGFVTRRMAMEVFPGEVFGVDMDPLFIQEAKKLAAKEEASNINFTLGNVDDLEFVDGVFDLSYSRLVLMHVEDPVKTVAELGRVTKRGGIVAISDQDDGGVIVYPELPQMMRMFSKYGSLAKMRGEDRFIGRKLFSIMEQAGLSPITVYPFPIYATQHDPEMLKMLVSVPVQIIESSKDKMIKQRLIGAEDYPEAMKEVQEFLAHPGAFAMGLTFLAVGKVP